MDQGSDSAAQPDQTHARCLKGAYMEHQESMVYRELYETETEKALDLVWNVFLEFEAPDYSEHGTAEFYRSIHDKQYLETLRLYGAFFKDVLVGIIATRCGGNHIALFFVDGRYQGHGIGRKLFELAAADNFSGRMTVNASPYVVSIYRHLGFTDTDSEQITHGIRYTPMESHILR